MSLLRAFGYLSMVFGFTLQVVVIVGLFVKFPHQPPVGQGILLLTVGLLALREDARG